MANDRRKWIDNLEWLPFAGAAAVTTQRLYASGDARAISQAYTRGAQAGAAMDRFASTLRNSCLSGLNLPKNLGVDKENYILEQAKYALGVKDRFATVNTFDEVNAMRQEYPELFEEVLSKAKSLARVDLGGLLKPGQLNHIPESQVISEALVKGNLQDLLGEMNPVLQKSFTDLRNKYHRTYGLADSQLVELRHNGELVGMRMSGGRTSGAPIIDLPILNAQGQLVSKRGNLSTPYSILTRSSGWRDEVPMDAYIMGRLEEELSHEAMITGRAGYHLRDTVQGIIQKSAYDSNAITRHTKSETARMFTGNLAIVEADSQEEITLGRKTVAQRAWAEGTDLTSGIPEGLAAKGVVYRQDFNPRLHTVSGYLPPDKKQYQTLSKPFNLAEESKFALEIDRDTSPIAHLFTPAAVGQETGRLMDEGHFNLQLNYGMMDFKEGEFEAFQQQVNDKFGKNVILSMHEDEIFLAEEMKRYALQERPLNYTLRQASGVRDVLQEGAELLPGTHLGADTLGREVFSGERGGREFVEKLERQGDTVVARIRNLIEPAVGDKVFGTRRIKNTVKGFLQADQMQTIYSMYLTSVKGETPKHALQMAANITGLTMGKPHKQGEMRLEELMSSLAEHHRIATSRGHMEDANEAARLLYGFGFDYQKDRMAPWRRTGDTTRFNYDKSAEEIYTQFETATSGPMKKVWDEYNLGLRRETITIGNIPRDLGAGRPASMSAEIYETLNDLGAGEIAEDLLARTSTGVHTDLQEIMRMMEPFTGKTQTGTNISKIEADMLTGENSLLHHLAPRDKNLPRVIHYGHTYHLDNDKVTSSYLQLPEQVTNLFKGVPTGEDEYAASEMYRATKQVIMDVKAHSLTGFAPGTLEQRAVASQENLALLLAQKLMTKEGAARQSLGGKITNSAILQAASTHWDGMDDQINSLDWLVSHKRFTELTQDIAMDEQQKILSELGHGNKYKSLSHAFSRGEAIPMVGARYPQERMFSAMPINVRSADYANRQYTKRFGITIFPDLKDDAAYINPKFFELFGGDFDADNIHLFMLKSKNAVSKAKDMLEDQKWSQEKFNFWQTQLKATKGGSDAERDLWFTTEAQVMGRLRQQEAGKVGIGPVSNALGRIRAGNRAAGQLNNSYWLEWIGEGAVIKARNWGLERFAEEDIIKMTMDKLTNRGEKAESRAAWLYKELIAPTRENAHSGAYNAEEVVGHIAQSLRNQDEIFKGSKASSMMRLLKMTKEQITAGKGLEFRAKLLSIRDAASTATSGLMAAVGDTSRVRSFVRNKASGITAAAESLARSMGKHKTMMGAGLAAGVGLAMLRKPRNLTPEGVTGSDLSSQGGLSEGNVYMHMEPRARVMQRQDGLNVRVRGRSTQELATNQLGHDLNRAATGRTQITVEDHRRRLTREDLRRLKR